MPTLFARVIRLVLPTAAKSASPVGDVQDVPVVVHRHRFQRPAQLPAEAAGGENQAPPGAVTACSTLSKTAVDRADLWSERVKQRRGETSFLCRIRRGVSLTVIRWKRSPKTHVSDEPPTPPRLRLKQTPRNCRGDFVEPSWMLAQQETIGKTP